MVMAGFTGHVRVLAGRQVDALHEVQVGEDVQRPEDGRPPDAEAPRLCRCYRSAAEKCPDWSATS